MNATRQTNTFSGGLSMDVDYSVLKDNQYHICREHSYTNE